MVQIIVAFVALSATGLSAAEPDYIVGRDAAAKLGTEESLGAFVELAKGPFSPAQQSDALEQASSQALALNRYEQAMELAKQIPTPAISKAAQMRILAARRDWQTLVTQFKDEEINAWWPDYVNGEALFCRGNAFAATGDGPRAVADLRQAADNIHYDENTKGLALNALGDAYRDLVHDDGRAIAAYRDTYQTSNIYKRSAAAMGVAGILARQNKLDDAWAELQTIDMEKVTYPYWRGCMLAAYGSILVKQGKQNEAQAKYREAAGLEGLPVSQKAAYERAVQELQAEIKSE